MPFNFENINKEIRQLMLQEINLDIKNNNVYYSRLFSDYGRSCYPDLLKNAVSAGDEMSLANSLVNKNCFVIYTSRNTKNGIVNTKVKSDAPISFSEGEFNRFYIRALCLYAIKNNKRLIVYRAKHVKSARLESENRIGEIFDPNKLLLDLREKVGTETVLGVPGGVNSGLSVKLSN